MGLTGSPPNNFSLIRASSPAGQFEYSLPVLYFVTHFYIYPFRDDRLALWLIQSFFWYDNIFSLFSYFAGRESP